MTDLMRQINFSVIKKNTLSPIERYKKSLNDDRVKYICTFVYYYNVILFERGIYNPITIIENTIQYDTLTNDPDHIYDEVNDKISNMDELILNDNVLATHTFKGPNGPKCVVTFVKKTGPILYFNPIVRQFQDVNSETPDEHIKDKVTYQVNNISLEFINWNFKRVFTFPKYEDEFIPENQIGISICKVCLENRIKILFQPCMHAICCIRCSTNIDNCPVCRNVINTKVNIFIG
ncbi:hypothetical protein AGMMS49579_01450 [Spirochaetia bacterium]|nr:hypothetical protein AGMMS49579_01450 [Spirochaetia bacterium]